MKRPILQAEAEVVAAQKAIRGMQGARDFDTYEREWRAFLNAIAKVWVKVERACQHVRNEFEPWQQGFKSCRDKDPLLDYLRHAKNADQHTVQEIVKVEPGSRSLGPVGGGPWHIDKLVLNRGEVIEYTGDKPLQVTDSPARVRLLPVTDRGVEYQPPNEHLGTALQDPSPVSIAEAALRYYTDFLESAKRRFFPS